MISQSLKNIIRFQACIGPSQKKAHLYSPDLSRPELTLCQTTTVVRNYKGALAPEFLCNACVQKYKLYDGPMPITCESIGVREIV